MTNNNSTTNLYTPELIETASIGVEFAYIVERGTELRQMVSRLLELLPRLYAQMLRLPSYFYSSDEDYIEEYITQEGYDMVRERLERLFADDDAFLTTMLPDMAYSDTPLSSTISEALADVYQHVGNLLGIIKEQNEIALPAAIGRCHLYWREHWGVQLLSTLPHLHNLYVRLAETDEDDTDTDTEEDSL